MNKNRAIAEALEPEPGPVPNVATTLSPMRLWECREFFIEGSEATERRCGWRETHFCQPHGMLALIDAMRARGMHFMLIPFFVDPFRATFASNDSYGTAVGDTIPLAVRDAALQALGLEGTER
jgi:hypothetical protein